MTGAEELEIFARIGGQRFEAYLDKELVSTTKYLTQATEPLQIYRAQGKALFIEEMKKLLAASKK
ncbi:MAG: hypothetical protein HXX17_07910 [Geobacteraceae bacterium]|nr:hypothetical protein [Geobacteraceae bacterium]